MKRFTYKPKVEIPESRMRDVIELRKFIMKNLRVSISKEDTYLFWSAVSESWSAGWLYIDTHYDHQTREEFLMDQLHEFGVLTEIN